MAEPSASQRPPVVQALRAVLQEDFDEEVNINRVEIRITEGGDVAFRMWPADGSDYIGGVTRAV